MAIADGPVRLRAALATDTLTFSTIKGMTDPATELDVYLRDESGTPATDTLQTISTHYTLTTLVDGLPTVVDMVTTPSATQRIVVVRNIPYAQNSSYSGSGAFPADSHEAALDKMQAQIQQLEEKLQRVPMLPEGIAETLHGSLSGTGLPLPEPIADKYLAYNSTADAIELKASTNSVTPAVQGDTGGSTDNAIPRWVSTGGDEIEDSGVTIADTTNNMSTPGNILATGTVTGNGFELGRENYRRISTDAQAITVSNNVVDFDNVLVLDATLPVVGTTHNGMRLTLKKTFNNTVPITITAGGTSKIDDLSGTTTTLDTFNEILVLVYEFANDNWLIVSRKTDTPWTSFTPTGSWTTNTTYTGQWRRVGDSMEGQVHIALGGAPDALDLELDIPFSLVISTAKLPSVVGHSNILGQCHIQETGVASHQGMAVYISTTKLRFKSYNLVGIVNHISPVTLLATDFVNISFKVPISGWNA